MIEFITDTSGIIQQEDIAFTFSEKENPRDFNREKQKHSFDWVDTQNLIGDYVILPYGSTDDLPRIIRDVVHENYVAPGILNKKTQLLWGRGPRLYREVYRDGHFVREWTEDREIQEWMSNMDAENYLLRTATDFQYIEGGFTKMIANKGFRINPKIVKLEHMSPKRTRLAVHAQEDFSEATHAIQYGKVNYSVYNLYNHLKPFASQTSVIYSSLPTFCSDFYTIPGLYGSMEWLKRSSTIPVILEALSRNSINVKYHIISPAYFWEQKKEELIKECRAKNKPYKEKYLIEFRNSYLQRVADTLSDVHNTGKFWHSIKYLEIDGQNILEHGWEIKEIKQDVRNFVQSQIDISKRADEALATGVGLHGALGNINVAGKADSGSEQLYALKNYLQTGVAIPEMIVTKAINLAIKANWPSKDIKVGFYHDQAKAESEIHSGDRIKENI